MSFETNSHAVVGFTRVIDRTCPSCRGIYASREHSMCPKCVAALVVPTVQTEKGIRPYCFTEVTIYPIMPEKIQKAYMEGIKKSKSLIPVFRLKIWGKYDEANNIVVPDGITPYLTPKRQIILKSNMVPDFGEPFETKHGRAIQILYVIKRWMGDSITLVGAKEGTTMAMDNAAALSAPAPKQAPVPTLLVTQGCTEDEELAKLELEIAEKKLKLLNMTKKAVPAPASAPAPITKQATTTDYTYDTVSSPDPTDMGEMVYEGASGYEEMAMAGGIDLFNEMGA